MYLRFKISYYFTVLYRATFTITINYVSTQYHICSSGVGT